MAQDVPHSLPRSVRLGCALLLLLVSLGMSVEPYLVLADEATPGTWQIVVGDETLPGRFNYPVDAAVDSQGNLYVLETSNFRIQKLSPDGKPLAQWGSRGNAPGQFWAPEGVAVDSRGNVYVADTLNDRIQKLSPAGEPLAQWGGAGDAPGQFSGPVSVAVDGQGNVYVIELRNRRVQKLAQPDGA